MSQAGPYIARSTIYDVCMNYLCAAKSAKIAMHLYLLVYHIIIKLQLLVQLYTLYYRAHNMKGGDEE